MARILVIEDVDEVRWMIRRTLEAQGYEVVEASGGIEGVELFREKPTDLIVTDILMPDKEGIEIIRELSSEFPDVKIIAISGGGKMGPYDYLELAKKFGASRTLAKPFGVKELIKIVQELLPGGEDS